MLYIMSFWNTLGKIGSVIASPISSVANSIIGAVSAKQQNKQMMQFQQQMADQQYQRQRELTADTPALEKQGLINAGMSPSALGAFSGPAASVASVPSSPSQVPVYHDFNPSTLIDAFLAKKQGEVADSEVYKNTTQGDKNAKEAGRYDELTDATINQIYSNVGLNQAEVSKINASIPVLDSQAAYYNYLAENEEVRWQTAQATKQSEIDRIKAENHLSEEAAKKKLSMIDDIINAQYDLTLAQIYNAKASGQAQLSNAYTNRLQYTLDKALNGYLQTYYRESAEKLKQEGISEDTLRQARLKLLDNDGDYSHAKKVYQDNLNSTYQTDNIVDNLTKVAGAVTGGVNSASSARNAASNARSATARELDSYTRASGRSSRKDVHFYHHKK